jgi:hypothetical protein
MIDDAKAFPDSSLAQWLAVTLVGVVEFSTTDFNIGLTAKQKSKDALN